MFITQWLRNYGNPPAKKNCLYKHLFFGGGFPHLLSSMSGIQKFKWATSDYNMHCNQVLYILFQPVTWCVALDEGEQTAITRSKQWLEEQLLVEVRKKRNILWAILTAGNTVYIKELLFSTTLPNSENRVDNTWMTCSLSIGVWEYGNILRWLFAYMYEYSIEFIIS